MISSGLRGRTREIRELDRFRDDDWCEENAHVTRRRSFDDRCRGVDIRCAGLRLRYQESTGYEVDHRFFYHHSFAGCPSSGAVGECASAQHSKAFEISWRQIFLDGREPADDAPPRWLGYSTGKWDGDVLVVDTKGFNGKAWLDPS